MAFHETRFPTGISFGSTGGPERRTEIVTLRNGSEERNAVWAHSRRRYDAGLGVRSLDDLAEVLAFFEARMGRLYGFRWKDWADFKSCLPSGEVGSGDQEIGAGDGAKTAFALTKAYVSGGVTYRRPISKPVAGSVLVAVDGVPLAEGDGWSVDTAAGQVTFDAAPAAGAVVTAGFAFDVPVRFDTDLIEANAASFAAGEIPSVPVIEVRV